MNFIFDTNAYRSFTQNLIHLSKIDKVATVNRLKICLDKKDSSIRINFWVLCEVLQHLCDINDPGYESCSETLKVILRLSANQQNVEFGSIFEVSLADKFNKQEISEHSKKLESNVAKLAVEFVENGRSEVFEKYICDVKIYIDNYKDQLHKGLTEAKVVLKRDGNKSIPLGDDDLHLLVLLGKIKGILNIEPDLVDEKILSELHETHYFGLARTIKVLQKGYNSDNLSQSFLNNFVDQAICDEIGKNNDTILVTDDGKGKEGVRTTFIEKDSLHRTMLLEEFLHHVEFAE